MAGLGSDAAGSREPWDWDTWPGPTRPVTSPQAANRPPWSRPSPALDAGVAPLVAPDVPPTQPMPGSPPRRRGRRASQSRRTPVGRLVRYGLALLVLLTLVLGGLALHRLYAFGQAISPQAPLSSQTGFMAGGQRVNLLVLGYGGAGHDGAYLTDSMLLISLVPGTGGTTLISVPRDLWVQVPPASGTYAKINTAYQDGLNNGYNGLPAGRLAGGAEAARKATDVTGLTVVYWVTLDFQGFRQLVDALGGVEVNVPVAFTAQYPINDDPSINAGWKTIHFNTGLQHMDGEQAIEYARARYVTDPVSQASDFARSVRQQQLLHAILDRARQISAWPGISAATDALQRAIYTNLSLADLLLFSDKLNLSHAHHVQLTDQNVLQDAQSDDGQDILIPAIDWHAVQQYVAQQLAG